MVEILIIMDNILAHSVWYKLKRKHIQPQHYDMSVW